MDNLIEKVFEIIFTKIQSHEFDEFIHIIYNDLIEISSNTLGADDQFTNQLRMKRPGLNLIYDPVDEKIKLTSLAHMLIFKMNQRQQTDAIRSQLYSEEFSGQFRLLIESRLDDLKNKANNDLTDIKSNASAQIHSEVTRIQLMITSGLAEIERTSKSQESYQKEIDKLVEKFRIQIQEVADQKAELDTHLTQVKAATPKLEKFLGDITKIKNIVRFDTLSKNNLIQAIVWGVFSAACIVILICFINKNVINADYTKLLTLIKDNYKLGYNHELSRNALLFTIIKSSTGNFILLTIGIYILVFSIKNFKACMHNYIIYSHKASALNSATTLSGAVKDESKDALILQAADVIFSHQHTGFTGKDADQAAPSVIGSVIEASKVAK